MNAWVLTTSLLISLGSSWGDTSDAPAASFRVLPGEVPVGEGDPNESPYRGPCSLDAQALTESSAKLATVATLVDALRPSDDLRDFQRVYRELTGDPCLRGLQDLDLNFANSSAPAVKAWWKAGGERWIRSLLELGPSQRYVVLPPDLPIVAGGSSDVVREAMQCPYEGRCDAGRDWRRRTDAALNAEFDACNTRPVEKDCSVDRSPSHPSRYRSWIRCAADRVSKRVELPIGAIQPPTEGWLTLRHVEPAPERTCAVTGIYSLSTGEAWVLDACRGGASLVGRAPLDSLRSLALLLAIRNDVRTSVRAKSVEVPLPLGLQPVWDGGVIGGVVGGMIGCHAGEHLPPRHLAWRVIAGGETAQGTIYASSGCNPMDRLIRRTAEAVKAQFKAGCVAGAKPSPATWAPLSESNFSESIKAAERRDGQAIEAMMRQTVARCGPTQVIRNDWGDRSTVDHSLERVPTGRQRAQ